MHQTAERPGAALHLWIILLTTLALAILYPIEILTTRRAPAGATSALEPAFSLPGGYYERDIQLKISAPNASVGKPSGVIFTVDGRVPTYTVGTVYTQPIHLSAVAPAVTVIRARAVLPGARLGPVVSASYFVGVPATLPMISLIMEPDDLWDPDRGIYANPFERGKAWERPADVTYVDKDRHLGFHIPAGVRTHGGGSRDYDKKSLRLYFRQEYGAGQLEYPLFAGSEVRSFEQLVLHGGGQDGLNPHRGNKGNWTLMRNQLADDLALELGGHATHNQPALVFINGEPWGIYQIRERLDDHFLADHYGIESADFLKAPELSPGQVIVMGDSEHWDHLLRFVETHDLSDPANYAHVQSQVDITNFIDYNILQIYAANADWPHHNVRQFRPRVQGGRWRWILWDTDSGFGAYPVYPYSRVDSNMIQHVLEYNHPRTGGRDLLLLRKLLETPAFLERFLSRSADLLNTTLAPRSVVAHIDALAAELEPDIAYETIRWSSSVNWASNVQVLCDFALRRPDFVRQHIVERFGLDGTAQLAFDPPASGSGYVAVNGFLTQDLPWQGLYFQGIPVQVMAAPAPGYRFAGWDPPDIPQTSVITLTINTTQTLTPRFVAISDETSRPGDLIFGRYRIVGDSPVEAARFELLVTRPGGVDLRGWRVTDNDAKTATDEGSLIFTDSPAFARVPRDTTILVVVAQTAADLPAQTGGDHLPQDDLSTSDRRMVLYTGNGNLDTGVDPGFNLGPNDNLVLLAPGPTQAFDDDRGIAFVAESTAVTPASFGVLTDGVLPTSITDRSQPDQQTDDQLPIWLFALAGLAVLCLNARWAVQRAH